MRHSSARILHHLYHHENQQVKILPRNSLKALYIFTTYRRVGNRKMNHIKIHTFKPIKLAYIEHSGRYDDVPYETYIPRLYAWAREHNMRPGFKNINVFHDDPQKVNPSECTCWIGIPVKGTASSDEEVRIAEIPEMQVATMKYKGPNSKYQDAYNVIGTWMEEQGYEWDGPSFEVCSKKPKIVNGQMILSTTIHVPLKKK